MSVAISVGNPCTGLDAEGEEHYRGQFARLSAALAEHGTDWSEPATPPPPGATRRHVSSFPYSALIRLHRVYALHRAGEPVPPNGAVGIDYPRDRILQAVEMFDSHLLRDLSPTGYYLPADLTHPLFVPESSAGSGDAQMVGASQGLLNELREIAPALGIALTADGVLADAEAARVDAEPDHPFDQERVAWLALHESGRASIAYGNAIVLS